MKSKKNMDPKQQTTMEQQRDEIDDLADKLKIDTTQHAQALVAQESPVPTRQTMNILKKPVSDTPKEQFDFA